MNTEYLQIINEAGLKPNIEQGFSFPDDPLQLNLCEFLPPDLGAGFCVITDHCRALNWADGYELIRQIPRYMRVLDQLNAAGALMSPGLAERRAHDAEWNAKMGVTQGEQS